MATFAKDTPRAQTRSRAAIPWCLAVALLGVLIADAMGPWLLHPTSRIAAAVGGDVSSSIIKFDQLGSGHVVPFLPGHLDGVAWPRGLPTTPGIDGASILSSMFLWVGSMLFGSIAAHGLEALLGYALTAGVTFAFTRRATGSFAAGVVAGVSYGFFPHMVAMVHAATTYSHMWLFILPIWAMWELAMRQSARRGLLAGAAVVPAM